MTISNQIDPVLTYRQAVEALNRSDWPQALALAGRVLPAAPEHAGVHFVAGVAAMQLQQVPLALQHLRSAVTLNPSRADYGAQWARALAAARLMREAVEAADAAAALSPDDPMTLDTLGVIYSQANAHVKAAEMFRRATVLRPELASFRFNLATSLTFSGDTAAAEQEYEACLARDPRYWKAHLALAQLRKQGAEDNHVERLQSLVQQNAGDVSGQMYLHLALSKEYEDLGERERSFEHLVVGKAAGRSTRRYSVERDAALFKALELAFAMPSPGEKGHDSIEPIFVIGMPRSGTTLVDRILSSHPQVHSAGELQNFGAILKRASGSRTPHLLDPDTIAHSRNLDWRRVGAAYIDSTRPGTGHTPRFIDKLPHNFFYAGHIAQALPNARIICLRRNPMDTCLSNFRQLFAQTSPYYDYSFDLLDTGRYYVMFNRLMAHWQRLLPGRILEIDYETIVDAQEDSTRRLLEFCGLSWDEACLRFEQNDAPVSTASAVQVREPIYRSALQRWKRYEKQLAGLRSLLEEAGISAE
ncbi:MAG TPA: sulfotransferase [Lysobacter sp.]|jgi:tetratricopeptide (TPR) repeat protein|nr:sulfotransferase [Lysobacter sp.]